MDWRKCGSGLGSGWRTLEEIYGELCGDEVTRDRQKSERGAVRVGESGWQIAAKDRRITGSHGIAIATTTPSLAENGRVGPLEMVATRVFAVQTAATGHPAVLDRGQGNRGSRLPSE